MKDRLPYIKFYPGDWQKDAGIRSLTFEEKGAWIEILMLMHNSEERGKLVMNSQAISKENLKKMLGIHGNNLNKILRKLEEKGIFSVDEKGVIFNRRMVQDEAFRKQQSQRGKLGGNPNFKAGKSNPYYHNPKDNPDDAEKDKRGLSFSDKPTFPFPFPFPYSYTDRTPHTPQGAEKVKIAYPDDFEKFWKDYPRQVGKGAAHKAWQKIKPDPALIAKFLEVLPKQKLSPQWQKDGGQFIPHPATWLNQRRWEDAPAAHQNEHERMLKVLEDSRNDKLAI